MVKRHTFPSFMGRCISIIAKNTAWTTQADHQCHKWSSIKWWNSQFFLRFWCLVPMVPMVPVVVVDCNLEAFAAVRADGRVVTWGSEGAGGNSSQVQETSILLVGIGMLKKTTRISFFVTSFVSIFWDDQKGPGCFIDVSWFLMFLGTLIQDQLHHVTLVASTDAAFAALRSDGLAICWGFSLFGGGTPLPGAAWKHRGVVAGETWWNRKLVMLEYGSSLYRVLTGIEYHSTWQTGLL